VKGSEISERAMEQAREFLEKISGVRFPDDSQLCSVPRNELVRIVAWYGQIRAGGTEPRGLVFDKDDLGAPPLRKVLPFKRTPESRETVPDHDAEGRI